jgi:hypothetical protein
VAQSAAIGNIRKLTRHPQSTRQSIIEQMDKQQVKAPHALRAAWREQMAELVLAKPPLSGLKPRSAQWLRPELRARVQHLKTKGTLRHATVKQLITD